MPSTLVSSSQATSSPCGDAPTLGAVIPLPWLLWAPESLEARRVQPSRLAALASLRPCLTTGCSRFSVVWCHAGPLRTAQCDFVVRREPVSRPCARGWGFVWTRASRPPRCVPRTAVSGSFGGCVLPSGEGARSSPASTGLPGLPLPLPILGAPKCGVHFPEDGGRGAPFHAVIGHLYILLGELSAEIFALSEMGLLCCCESSLCAPCTRPLRVT